jgi:tRNA A-37 threonylcarbamoyl transferase component Bud32
MSCNPKGFRSIGHGVHGKVLAKQKIAIKVSREDMFREFKIFKKAYKLAPRHIPKPYLYRECEKKTIIYHEYIRSKTLKKYGTITKCILYKILKTLYILNKHNIIHNDLHLKNILISETGEPYIIDFGLSDSKAYTALGEKYDYHRLLNAIYSILDRPEKSVVRFIKSIFPKEYLGKKSLKIHDYILRYNVDHSSLPSLGSVIRNRYFEACRK